MTERTVGHYRIQRELGRGGMGIVYEALDTKLHRKVALKVLSPHLLSSDDDRARFYREARSAAQLNHPNIAVVHAVDEVSDENGDPTPFIAMELIEGQTLRTLIDEGPLKIEDAIRITKDIASALRAAHEKHIVHRDIKSANVMITEGGLVKVLDFGLAKTAQSTMLTKTGSTLGTAAYMSPEQASSADVDRRSDIWSLGVVLYEMVAGKLPFGAAYEQAVVYSILNEDPEPLTSIRTGVPIELERIVTKCLMKDPALRYQHADDLVADLAAVQPGSGPTRTTVRSAQDESTGPKTNSTGLSKVVVGVLMALAFAAGALAFWLAGDSSESRPGRPYHVSIVLPEGVSLSQGETAPLHLPRMVLALSPDGRSLVFVGKDASATRLYLRHLDDFEARPMTGTEGAYGPFFSPDGQWVAFYASDQLKKVSVDGTPPLVLGPASLPTYGVWTADGTIVYGDNEGFELMQIRSDGGRASAFGFDDLFALSSILPDGTVIGEIFDGTITLYPGGSGPGTPTGHIGDNAQIVADRWLLYGTAGALFAVPLDPRALLPVGERKRVVDGVWSDPNHALSQFAVSTGGDIAFVRGPRSDVTRLVWLDRDGAKEPLAFEPRAYRNFKISPDGSRIAVSWETTDRECGIWILDPARSTSDQLTRGAYDSRVNWTPDGEELVHRRCADQRCEIVAIRVAGSGETRSIAEVGGQIGSPYAVSPDGKAVIVSGNLEGIARVDLDGSGTVQTLILEPGTNTWAPSVHPDGRHIAYTSDRTQQYEIWVEPIPPTGSRWRASIDGGEEPVWSRDGSELFYRYENRLFAVEVRKSGESLDFGPPEVIYEGPFFNLGGVSYDVGPDGRFLILEPAEEPDDLTHIHLISKEWMGEE